MYNLIRFYNQNKKKIFKIILIIVFIFGILQLLNYLTIIKSDKSMLDAENKTNSSIIDNKINSLVSDKSFVSGSTISSSKLEKDTNVINQFIDYCNKKDITSAYDLLTYECKEEMFPTIQDFYNIYYSNLFNGEKKFYTIENWVGDTYTVRVTSDILSTGNLSDNETRQDYITIVDNNGESKLNINSYIKRTILNKVTLDKNIKITVNAINTYMDYEVYNITIENNSNNTILLDTNDDTKSVYLLDNNNMKYYFYNNEIIQNKLILQSKFKTDLQIKFTNSYSSSRTIKNMVFTKMVLNYEDYINFQNKVEYSDFYTFKIDL